MSLAVARVAVDIFFIRETDDVAGDMMEVVAAQKLQRLNHQKIVGCEPVEDGLLKEGHIVMAGLERQNVAVGIADDTDAVQFGKVPPHIAAPIQKAAIAGEARA